MPLDETVIDSLIRRAANGDGEALEPLLEHYLPQVRAFVRLRTGPLVRAHESCSDLVQSVCREVFEHADRFQHPNKDAFKRWLFSTALRKILNRHRFYTAEKRDARRLETLDDSGPGEAGGTILDCYRRFSSPSRKLQVREELERIEAVFEKLQPEYREVISLAHIAGLPRKEIAAEMGRSEGAIRILLHRAIARVTVLLGDTDEG